MATYQDVELLNRSMERLGDTFRQNRLDTRSEEQRKLENDLRERMLGIQQSRADKATEHEKRMEEMQSQGHVKAYFTDPTDGSVLEYSGPLEGVLHAQKQFQQAGRNVQISGAPTKPLPPIAVEAEIGGVKTRQYFHDQTAADKYRESIAARIDPNTKMPREWDRDPKKSYVTSGGAVVGPVRSDPTELETVTEVSPPVPAVAETAAEPPRKGFLGIGADPGKPAVPGRPAIPETRRTYKRPVGALPGTTPGVATPNPAGPSAPEQFANEAAARAAGHKAGDVIYLEGVGKVRLK